MQAQTVQTGGEECLRATRTQADVLTGRKGVGESARAMLTTADAAVLVVGSVGCPRQDADRIEL